MRQYDNTLGPEAWKAAAGRKFKEKVSQIKKGYIGLSLTAGTWTSWGLYLQARSWQLVLYSQFKNGIHI
jgi:cysteine synthase